MFSGCNHPEAKMQDNVAGKIFNIQSDKLIEMKQTGFSTELDFQKLLADYPDLLAGDQIDTIIPRRWLLIKREMGITDQPSGNDRWLLDHLFLDQDGVPTLVEVKRSTDPRLRREVVGQVLDYAANGILHWTSERIKELYKQTCDVEKADADERLESFLVDPDLQEVFWENVKTNLSLGKIRILIVADIIPPELRCVVEFLNKQMNPAEILAIEIRQFEGQGIKTLVPLVFGQASETRPNSKPQYNLTKFIVTIDGVEYPSEVRRRAVLRVVRALAKAGKSPEEINKAIPWRKVIYKIPVSTSDESLSKVLAVEYHRKNPESLWFLKDADLIAFPDGKYVVEKHWGKRAGEALDSWIKEFNLNVSYKVVGQVG